MAHAVDETPAEFRQAPHWTAHGKLGENFDGFGEGNGRGKNQRQTYQDSKYPCPSFHDLPSSQDYKFTPFGFFRLLS
jgi:hypothetical protein